jgi:hypothetical protein
LIEQYRLDKMKAIFETPVPAEPSVK